MPIRPVKPTEDAEAPTKKLEPLSLDAGAVARKPEPLSLDAGALSAKKADGVSVRKPEPISLDAGAMPERAVEPTSLDAGARKLEPKADGKAAAAKTPAPTPPAAGGDGAVAPGPRGMPPVAQLKGRPLGRILIKMGKVNRTQVQEALEIQKNKHGPIG